MELQKLFRIFLNRPRGEKIILAGILGFFVFFTAFPANAAPIQNVADFVDKMCLVFTWMFVFLIVISALMGLFGGYLYLTSGGDAEKVTRANKKHKHPAEDNAH